MSRPVNRGQATVELALALPLITVVLLALVQFVIVVRDQLALDVAARVAARAASIGGPDAARSAAESSIALHPVTVEVSETGEDVVVTVRYRSVTEVPLVGALIGDPDLRASVTMRREPP